MEIETLIELIAWLAGIFGSVFLFFCAIWWRTELRQDKKLDAFIQANSHSHRDLHLKIEETQKQLNQDHRHLLSKIEEIWREIVPTNHRKAEGE